MDTQGDKQMNRKTERYANGQIDIKTYKWRDRKTDERIDGKMDERTNRRINIEV
jgi:hypothetical protein